MEWALNHNGIYYTADESAAPVQRKYFALAIEQALPGFASVEYSDWHSLFMRLAREAAYVGWKGPLIIDEHLISFLHHRNFLVFYKNFLTMKSKRQK